LRLSRTLRLTETARTGFLSRVLEDRVFRRALSADFVEFQLAILDIARHLNQSRRQLVMIA
jgi:hypothetical protein